MKPTHNRLVLFLSWVYLLWERLARAFWMAAVIVSFGTAVALLGLPAFISPRLHVVLIISIACVLLIVIWRGIKRLQVPTQLAALRRLQRINNLDHRPLESLGDRLPEGLKNDENRELWEAHHRRLAERTAELRLGIPQPHLNRIDPMAWRLAVFVLLIAALAAAGNAALERLRHGLVPKLALFEPPPTPIIDAWLTPPAYTGVAPSYLAGGNAAAKVFSAAPAGTTLSVRISSSENLPRIVLSRSETMVRRIDEQSFSADLELLESDTVAIMLGEEMIAEWAIRITPDAPPKVSFLSIPSEGKDNVLRINYRASDDHGLASLRAVVMRDRKKSAITRDKIDLTLPRIGAKKAVSSSFQDLTDHAWSGLPVSIHLETTDGAGQTGKSGAVRIIMPERAFRHPVARKIVIERRKLMADPLQAKLVADALYNIASQPGRFRDDVTVYLTLRSAARRLGAGPNRSDQDDIEQLLWSTALRIEDGKFSIAKQKLHDAEKAFREAIENSLEDHEIARLMNELELALNRYFDEFAKMMKPNGQETAHAIFRNDRMLFLSRRDFAKLVNEIRKLAQSGSQAYAQQLLSQLRSLIENMQTRYFEGMPPRGQTSMKLLNRLQILIKDQQKLLDQTFKDAQHLGRVSPQSGRNNFGQSEGRRRDQIARLGDQPPGDPLQSGPMLNSAQTQEALRRRLGNLMRQLGGMINSIPQAMGNAERAMHRSSYFLKTGKTGKAIQYQYRTLDQLQQTAKAATRELMKQHGQGLEQWFGNSGRQLDPFGRTPVGSSGINTGDIGISNGNELQRPREIRKELRRRAGQHQRPEIERAYIDRLLKEF